MSRAFGWVWGGAAAVVVQLTTTGGCNRCPKLPEPPRVARFTVIEALDVDAVGGSARLAEEGEGSRDRVFTITYDSGGETRTVVYFWP